MNNLDKEVAEALGYTIDRICGRSYGSMGMDCWLEHEHNIISTVAGFTPSTNWQQAGELLEKFKFTLGPNINQNTGELEWLCYKDVTKCGMFSHTVSEDAQTPQEAICKAVIALCKEKEHE